MLSLLVAQKATLWECVLIWETWASTFKVSLPTPSSFQEAIQTSKKPPRVPHRSLQIANQILGLEASSVSSSTKLPTLSHPSEHTKHFAFIHTRHKVSDFSSLVLETNPFSFLSSKGYQKDTLPWWQNSSSQFTYPFDPLGSQVWV